MDFKEKLDLVPWASRGRRTAISDLASSVVPIGTSENVIKGDLDSYVELQSEDHESKMLEILGTAFQAAPGKLLTCWHVVEELHANLDNTFFLAWTELHGVPGIRPYPLAAVMRYYDIRFDDGGPGIDCGLLICPPARQHEAPYLVPPISWADSTNVGVGDRVLIGGYPLGKEIFFANDTNRGLVQPSFFEGIVSAIIPALSAGETRLFQISSVSLRGMSGGVVCLPDSGRVIGMITSGVASDNVDLPITYAIPSEVLEPFVDAVSFNTKSGKWD